MATWEFVVAEIRGPDCWDVPPDVVAAISDLLGTSMVSATMRL